MSDYNYIDSDDLYAMGLRAPRCNGCSYTELRWKLGDKCLTLNDLGWFNVYELDREPADGQGEPKDHEGRPIHLHGGFMSIGHSDECWHFKAPAHSYVEHVRGQTWRTSDNKVIPIKDLGTCHLINIIKLLLRNKGEAEMLTRVNANHVEISALVAEAATRHVTVLDGTETTALTLAWPTFKTRARKGLWRRIIDGIRNLGKQMK